MFFVFHTYIKMLSGPVYVLLCWLHSLLVSPQLLVPLFLPHWIILLAASLDFTFHLLQDGYPKSACSCAITGHWGFSQWFEGKPYEALL